MKQLNEELEKRPPAPESEDSFDNGEFNDRTGVNSEIKAKLSSVRRAPPTDGINGTSKIESLSQNENVDALKPGKNTVKISKRNSDSEGDLSLFERDEEDEDLLENHLSRREREKEVKGNINSVKEENEAEEGYEEEFEPELSESEDDKVIPVTKEEVIPMAKTILNY